MLDDDAGRGALGIELGDAFVSRVGVVDVVVGQLLTLHLPRRADAEARARRPVERGALVRVLAVAQRLDQFAAKGAVIGRVIMQRVGKPVGDRCVIGGRARIGLGGERLAQFVGEHAGMLRHFAEHFFVVGRLHHHRDVGVVLGGGADHGRSADVDVLDAIVVGRAVGDGGLERVEVHHQQVDRLNAVLLHRLGVFGIGADRQQPAVHLRMQRLHPSVHHFRKAGELGNVGDGKPGVIQRLGGAAGGNELDAVVGKLIGEFDQAGLVGDRQQGAGDAAGVAGHGKGLTQERGGSVFSMAIPALRVHRTVCPGRRHRTLYSGNSGSASRSGRAPGAEGGEWRKHQRTLPRSRARP